jgi:kynurenine 3-monooxygenase
MTGPRTPAGRRAAVIGAGLAGGLCAVYLSRAGWDVVVFERREDPRRTPEAGGRSINLGLSARGIAALDEVGLREKVLRMAVPMRGRMIHDPDGDIHFQPYGTRDSEILHSILRTDLTTVLIDQAEARGVRFRFGHTLTALDPDSGEVLLAASATGVQVGVTADLIIGADGAFSAVRRCLEQRALVRTTVDTLEWGYKELTIPAGPDGSPRTPLEGLHVWPGGQRGLIVAHPNRNASLTATLFLALNGDESLATLTDPAAVEAFFAANFPDTAALMPDRVAEVLDHPVGTLVTVRTSPWTHGDRVVLIGDACHAVYPFYGQGMNAAFEDVLVLADCLMAEPADRGAALARFQRQRKRHTDALADMSEDNFGELRDRLRSPWFRFRKRADLVLHRAFPRTWAPLYTMIAHRRTPYADARARARRQELVLAVGLAVGALAGARFVAAMLRIPFSKSR